MESRREFVKKSALIGTGLALAPTLSFGSVKKEKLNVGLIGVGLRGTNHLNNLLLRKDIAITAICDIDPKRIDLCLDLIKKANFSKPKTFGKDELDYRKVCAVDGL